MRFPLTLCLTSASIGAVMMAVPWEVDMAGEHDTNGTSGSDMSLALIEEQADASIRRIYQDGR